MGGPVAEIERPRAAALERIAAVRDLAHVQEGAVADQPVEGLGGEESERLGLALRASRRSRGRE